MDDKKHFLEKAVDSKEDLVVVQKDGSVLLPNWVLKHMNVSSNDCLSIVENMNGDLMLHKENMMSKQKDAEKTITTDRDQLVDQFKEHYIHVLDKMHEKTGKNNDAYYIQIVDNHIEIGFAEVKINE